MQACDTVIEAGKKLADEVACYILGKTHALTRYANNQIIQHVRKNEIQLVVRVLVDGKIGMASGNQLDSGSIEQLVKKAVELSQYAAPDPHFAGFAEPGRIPAVHGFDESTEQVTPMEMAEAVQVIAARSQERGLEAAGACQILLTDQAVANSRGVRLYGRHSKAEIHAVVMSDTSSGYAVDTKSSFYELQPAEVARVAIEKCEMSKNPRTIEIGDYPVILEPKAVADMLMYLAFSGFNPVPYHEGQSFLSGRMGEKVFDERITITEDPLSKESLPFAFDWDGQPKQRTVLIDQGGASGMVYDDYYGKRYGAASTGNALFPTERFYGAIPLHLHVKAGDTPVAEMIKQMKKGILVTRFHYLGMIHPKKSIVTGMTRDGTFLIEEGEIVAPLKNLRMTQSIEEALNNVIAVGNECKTISGWVGHCHAPALMLDRFSFTGLTDH